VRSHRIGLPTLEDGVNGARPPWSALPGGNTFLVEAISDCSDAEARLADRFASQLANTFDDSSLCGPRAEGLPPLAPPISPANPIACRAQLQNDHGFLKLRDGAQDLAN
jgi:hypothetical protein